MKKIITVLFFSMAFSINALAIDINGTTKATATLRSSCILSTSDVNFGDITQQGTSTTIESIGHIFATCSNNLSYNIALGNGLNWLSVAPYGRYMKGVTSGQKIYYTLSTGSNSWYGDPYTTYTVNKVGTGMVQDISVFGQTSTNYNTPDNYSDTMTVTISY